MRSKQITPGRGATESLEQVSALVYALFHDLAAWLSGTEGPVDAELYPDYRLAGVGSLPSPAERMAQYLAPPILEQWRPAIEGWCRLGFGYQADFGRSLAVLVTVDREEGIKASARFQDQSEIECHRGRTQAPAGRWALTCWAAAGGQSITALTLRPIG